MWIYIYIYFIYLWCLNRTKSTITTAIYWTFYQLWMIDGDECGATGTMNEWQRNRSTRRKPGPLPLCPPQISHDLSRDRTRTSAVESRRLTAWATERWLWADILPCRIWRHVSGTCLLLPGWRANEETNYGEEPCAVFVNTSILLYAAVFQLAVGSWQLAVFHAFSIRPLWYSWTKLMCPSVLCCLERTELETPKHSWDDSCWSRHFGGMYLLHLRA
jgi:hypothetical protein